MKTLIGAFIVLCVGFTINSFAQKKAWLLLPNTVKQHPCIQAQFKKHGISTSDSKKIVGILKGSSVDGAIKKHCKIALPQNYVSCCCEKRGTCICWPRQNYCKPQCSGC